LLLSFPVPLVEGLITCITVYPVDDDGCCKNRSCGVYILSVGLL